MIVGCAADVSWNINQFNTSVYVESTALNPIQQDIIYKLLDFIIASIRLFSFNSSFVQI